MKGEHNMKLIIGYYDEIGYAEHEITKNPCVEFSKNGFVSYVDDFDFHECFPVERLCKIVAIEND
jgi:hypothetical protein